MHEEELKARLNAVVNELCGRSSHNALAALVFPFDIDQPNEHNSKKEFLLEQKAVKKALKSSRVLIDLFHVRNAEEDVKTMVQRLRNNLDVRARKSVRPEIETPDHLVTRNMLDVGFSRMAHIANIYLWLGLSQRERELDDQEKEFWSVSHRPPNYYARTIALRMARLYAHEKGERPTYGTARDGGHPSTRFGRAVEQVFQILDIEADVRTPIEWAIDQLTEDDLNSERIPGFGTGDDLRALTGANHTNLPGGLFGVIPKGTAG